MTNAQMHARLKRLSPVTCVDHWVAGSDTPRQRIRSLTELTHEEFDEFLEDMKRHAAIDFGFYIEDMIPNHIRLQHDKDPATRNADVDAE
jgi:hypothetical protein